MEKLMVSNFAGMDELEIQLNKINLFIGPQATGKSVTIKLIYFFNSFFNIVEQNIITKHKTAKNLKEVILDNYKETFLSYFPFHAWGDKDFEIRYSNKSKDFEIILSGKKRKLNLELSDKLEEIIYRSIQLFEELKENSDEEKQVYILFDFFNKYKNLLSHYAFENYHNVFIPAGRSFFSNIKSNIFSLLSQDVNLDPFIKDFGKIYEIQKNAEFIVPEKISTQQKKELDRLFRSILQGEYLFEKDEEYIVHNDGRKVNLVYASSGQQEIVPLLRILDSYYTRKNSGAHLYIEEPEAHLYPGSQYTIVKILARIFNSDNNFRFFITTHSPYILASFNNLMYAGILKEKIRNTEELIQIIPEEEMIKPDIVKAYSLEYKGNATDIINPGNKLIDQNVLDDVSNTIAEEFDQLLNLEFES